MPLVLKRNIASSLKLWNDCLDEDGRAGLVIVARAVRTRGLKGELVADLLTDFPDRFEAVSELWDVGPDGERSCSSSRITGFKTIAWF